MTPDRPDAERVPVGQIPAPRWARDAPDRAVVIATHEGALQVYSWTPSTGTLVLTTDRPTGLSRTRIDPPGQWVWWYEDHDGGGAGQWWRQPFGSTPGRRAQTPLPFGDAHPAGLLLGDDDLAVLGRRVERAWLVHAVHVGPDRRDEAPVLLHEGAGPARAAALSHDDRLVAVEHGDAEHPSLRVVRTGDGRPVAGLDDGPSRGLHAHGFAPRAGDQRLLVRHQRAGAARLLVWDVEKGLQRQLELGVPGEVLAAAWFPDARNALVAVGPQARPRLYRLDLFSGAVADLTPPDGTVVDAVPRPDGDVWVVHRADTGGTTLRSTAGGAVPALRLAGPSGPSRAG